MMLTMRRTPEVHVHSDAAFTYRNHMRYSDAVTPKVMRNAVPCIVTL